MDIQNITDKNFRSTDFMGTVKIPCIVSKQGSRISYQFNLKFRQITNLLDHTEPSPNKSKDLNDIDIEELRNRYLRTDKVKDIKEYIHENIDSYILPPISAVSDKEFSFIPYFHEEIKEHMGDEYDLRENPHLIDEVLEKFDGMVQGFIEFKESEFNVEILDGNHRVAAIHQLSTLGKLFKDLRIGIQIFIEKDIDRQKQAFVDMNTSTPIDKTIITLFGNRDILSIAAKETIGKNSDYKIDEFDKNSEEYIGFDAINDSVTRNSQAVISLNMVKNMMVKFALGDTGTPKKFTNTYTRDSEEYKILLNDFTKYMRAVFNEVDPFVEIKLNGIQEIPKLREKYISLTGAGLYVIANLGHMARKNNKNLEHFVRYNLSKIDWKRTINEKPNKLFLGGIISENGKISNNRNAIKSTLEVLEEELKLKQ